MPKLWATTEPVTSETSWTTLRSYLVIGGIVRHRMSAGLAARKAATLSSIFLRKSLLCSRCFSSIFCCISRCFFLSAFCFSVAVGGPVILPMIDPSKSMAVVGVVVRKSLQVQVLGPLICPRICQKVSQESQVVFVQGCFRCLLGNLVYNSQV